MGLERLLDGRSVLDLRGWDSIDVYNELKYLVKSKPLSSFTPLEYKALIEELVDLLGLSLFKGEWTDRLKAIPKERKQAVLKEIEKWTTRSSHGDYFLIIDSLIRENWLWIYIDRREQRIITRDIMKYLAGENLS
jgi:hypothetical protein